MVVIAMLEGPELHKRVRKKGFEALSRETIQGIKHADGLAIWTLFSSMPDKWVIRRKWAKEMLKIGDERYRKGVRRLRELGLWKVVRLRSDKGYLCGSKIELYDEILEPTTPKHRDVDNPHPQESESPENASTYETEHIKEVIKIKPAKLVTNEEFSLQDYENLIGVEFPSSVLNLDSPKNIAPIISKSKLSSEDTRTVFAEFSASVKRGTVRDPRALFVSFVAKAKANTLNLSKEGEENLPPWV